MKFLVDESLSTRVARLLAASGHDTVHVDDLGLLASPETALAPSPQLSKATRHSTLPSRRLMRTDFVAGLQRRVHDFLAADDCRHVIGPFASYESDFQCLRAAPALTSEDARPPRPNEHFRVLG